jgi:hypothetical protein
MSEKFSPAQLRDGELVPTLPAQEFPRSMFCVKVNEQTLLSRVCFLSPQGVSIGMKGEDRPTKCLKLTTMYVFVYMQD